MRVACGLHRGMEGDAVRIVVNAALVQHRREIGASAEPRLAGHDEPRVHMDCRHVRIVRMRDQRNAGGPETRVLLGTRYFLAEFRREFAVHGRAMHADFLEHAAMHHRHHAAAAGRTSMVGTLPGRADEAARRAFGEGGIRRQGAFQALECGANIVAQCLEPGARLGFASVECRAIHFHINSLGQFYHRAKSCVCRKASPATIAAATAILSERMPDCMGMRRRTSARS